MTTAAFDTTLQTARAIEEAGLERKPAEAIAEGINQAVNRRGQDYTTKAEKADFAALRIEMASMKVTLLPAILGAVGIILAGLAISVVVLVNLLR